MNIKSIIYTMLAMCLLTSAVAQTKTIAHRGYWEVEGSVENSISSFMK